MKIEDTLRDIRCYLDSAPHRGIIHATLPMAFSIYLYAGESSASSSDILDLTINFRTGHFHHDLNRKTEIVKLKYFT